MKGKKYAVQLLLRATRVRPRQRSHPYGCLIVL